MPSSEIKRIPTESGNAMWEVMPSAFTHHMNEIGNGFNRAAYDWLTKLQQWPNPHTAEPKWGNALDVGKWMRMLDEQRAMNITITRERRRALISSVPRLNYVRAYNDAQRAIRVYGIRQAIENANENWAGIEELMRRRHV